MAGKRVYLGDVFFCGLVIKNSATNGIILCPNTSENSPGKGCPNGHAFWVCGDHYNYITCCLTCVDKTGLLCGKGLIPVETKIKLRSF